ncbi:MAG: type II secretion system protein GspM [Gammaproteobacteria bacterium]|nr:type II secretion system protein GspM [Gammaproteobacteria bacterium]
MTVKERISAWAERYEAFSLRERGLVIVGVIVLLFMLWDSLLMTPEQQRQTQIVAQMQAMNQQTEALNLQIQEMSAALRGGEAQHIQARTTELQALLAGLAQKQEDLTVQFIQPRQMAAVLRDMLSAENGLELTQLTSLGAQPLFPPTREETENAATSAAAPALKTTARSHRPEVFKHGLRIVFEGDYFKTLAYLRALEAMPWRLYWDNVEYLVTDYPRARVAITVHTLSLHEGWIGV